MDKQKRKGYSNNKSYYNKRSRQYSLETGMTGFLCTCNFREKECVRDAYKILEEFASELYGPDEKKMIKDNDTKVEKNDDDDSDLKKIDESSKDDDEEDISDALSKEIEELKAEAEKPPSAKRFQSADAGVKNVIFISTTLPDPLELALTIFKKLHETKEQITRFVLRLVPIQIVCKANITEIKSTADKVFEKYFAQEPKTFSIVFNRHCNGKIKRNEIIEELAELIAKKNPGNKADLTNPEIAVVVEVIRGFCLLSIAPDYFKYKKYNLLELCSVKEPEKPSKEADVAPASDDEKKCEDQDDEATKETAESETTEIAEEQQAEQAKVEDV